MEAHRSTLCIGCWQQMRVPVALRGPFSIPFRVLGIRPSRMNPNTCTICELMFTRIMKARKITIDATILFADLRGYTSLSQSRSAEAVSGLLDAFYDECAAAIWQYDGLLNKTIGDAIMAVFNFPIKHEHHARNALLAARDIQRRTREKGTLLQQEFGLKDGEFGIGIGIDTGQLSFGEFGRSHRDLTAIGDVVNTAARAQAAAASGEILMTSAVHDRVGTDAANAQAKEYQLKGFAAPTSLYSA